MRPVNIGVPIGQTTEAKVAWLIKAVNAIAINSKLDLSTESVTEAEMTAAIAAAGATRAFRASLASDQSGLSVGANKIEFDTENLDEGGYYDLGTMLWTPPAGIYLVTFQALVSYSGSEVVAGKTDIVITNGSEDYDFWLNVPETPASFIGDPDMTFAAGFRVGSEDA